MLRTKLVSAGLLLTAALAHAAIFPDSLGDYAKGPTKELAAPDPALFQEYGFEAAEQAEFTSPTLGKITASAWRFHDSTGAMAAAQSQRPPKSGQLDSFANYVFLFDPKPLGEAELDQLHKVLPRIENSPLPVLKDYLPADGLIPNSPRYVVGPVSLAKFEPRISPSLAAFHLSAEAQLGQYSTTKGPMTLAIFNYPTPNMARARLDEFQKIPNAVAKRSATLVAVIVEPPDPNAAESLLAKVVYQQNITLNEKVPENIGRQMGGIFLGSFALAGVFIVICLVTGVGLGTLRILMRKLGWKVSEPEQMIVLGIDQHANK
ncbi:MAG TPA: hypothetical protein VGN17_19795 [Bryobacteraceae bacterium]|jgi:hypothetical protein